MVYLGAQAGGDSPTSSLIRPGGDDGTRTYDPCLQMTRTVANTDGWLRQTGLHFWTFANGGGRLRVVHEWSITAQRRTINGSYVSAHQRGTSGMAGSTTRLRE